MLISLLLVTTLGIVAARLMWLIITPTQTQTGQFQTIENVAIKTKQKVNYGKLIANQHIFGVVEVKKAPIVNLQKHTKAPKVTTTKLNLKLHGIVAYKSPKDGYALISSSNGKQKVYSVGDSLQEGVTVVEIFSDKVVLDNHGKSEELILPIKDSKATQKQKSASSNFSNLPGNNNRKSNLRPFNDASNIDLNKVRQEALSSPQKLLEIASPSPAIINGKFIGFRVRPGRKRQIFTQLGFRPNDIITEVNGIILDDASKGAMILGELSQASELAVTVKRGSQEIVLPTLQF